MTDTTPTVAATVTTSVTPAAVLPADAPAADGQPIKAPTVVTTAVSWYTPTAARWIAYRGYTRIGSIDHVGAYIATNQHMDVLGAFVELADAQLAIVDPQPADADLVRRTRAHRIRQDARLRRAALIAMGALFVMLVLGAVVVLASVR